MSEKSLSQEQTDTFFKVPTDPSIVHPISAFPPMSLFDLSHKHPALTIPARRTAELRNRLRNVLMHRPKIKSVYPSPQQDDTSCRVLVLKDDPLVYNDPVVESLLQEDGIQRCSHVIKLEYKDWSVEQVLKKLLPVKEVPSSFEIAGHVAHINLTQELLPFKHIVGKVILDKNSPQIKTVVNKVGSIETQFRTFGMEILAGYEGENWSVVNVKEKGCSYTLDFRNVYWNSRLAGEHCRLVRHLKKVKAQIVADVMAGVGPFAVPLTSSKTSNNNDITVHANDLNPTSYHYLKVNGTQNKCHNLHTYNMDGRAFVHKLDERGIKYDHVIMNLPATAPEFLDAFWGYPHKTNMPRIHVHCFGPKTTEAEQEAIDRCGEALKCGIDKKKHNVSVHVVRDVSPKKNMLCVSFTLPQEVCDIPRLVLESQDAEEPDAKRIKST